MNRRNFISAAAGIGLQPGLTCWFLGANRQPRSEQRRESLRTPGPIEFDLETRDPNSNQILIKKVSIDPARTGIVIIDLWNYHWCMTAAQRVGALVPHLNEALRAARRLGMQVVWAPTDVANQYVGTPQRERSMAVPYFARPAPKEFVCHL